MIYNNKAQKWIGTGITGAANAKRCEEYLGTLHQNAVCTYADDGFRAYNADSGLPLGKGTAGSLERCAQYIQTAKNGLMCAFYQDDGFRIYRIKDGVILGNGEGPGSLERCVEYMQTASNGLICHYFGTKDNDRQFKSIKIADNSVYGYPFETYSTDLNACKNQIGKFHLTENGVEANIAVKVEKAKKILESEISPFLKKLSRKTYFYSYYGRDELKVSSSDTVDLKSPKLLSALEKWRQSVEEYVPYEQGWLGFGLYGAVNPVDSQKYAGDDWILSEIEMKAGATFLDLRVSDEDTEFNYSFHLSDDAKESLQELCLLDDDSLSRSHFEINKRKYDWSITKPNLIKSRVCHTALKETLKKLDVSFLVYNWYYVRENGIRDYTGYCESKRSPAVVFTKSLMNGNVKFFSEEGNSNFISEYQRIYQLASLRSGNPEASWPSFKDPNAKKINVEEENNSQFGCKKVFSEDEPVWAD